MKKSEKKLTLFSILGISLTGILIFIFDEFFKIETDYGLRSHYLLDEFKLIHNLFNFLFVFTVGVIFNSHILLGLKKIKKDRFYTGFIMSGLTVILIISGVSLLYLSSEALKEYGELIHLGSGILFILSFVVHFVSFRKKNYNKE